MPLFEPRCGSPGHTLARQSEPIGLAGGGRALKPLENSRFEVLFEATLWASIKQLREVIALAESGRLRTIPIERVPLERINEVYRRLKSEDVAGRAVIAPAA
jgi:D-arabinose 1-dehydrogenase-like Zn-dependent alcohol dehydrogenase